MLSFRESLSKVEDENIGVTSFIKPQPEKTFFAFYIGKNDIHPFQICLLQKTTLLQNSGVQISCAY